ncbi:bifunctional glutamate N-acetyltransferase/amino-acid acetyltransferase ArgJ [bacterium]|nr:bifunctional glutamate N-acetyltransferase/amino-acid acetyltransferase ArgJ [bacterium]
MSEIKNTVPGFKGSAVAAGLKKDGALDLALIVSEREAVAAGVFTTNRVTAAPVILSQEHIKGGKAKAIIVNSGNANACTGKDGLRDAQITVDLVADALGVKPEEVLVASTGVIGAPLDMGLISRAVPDLVKGLVPEGLSEVADAIMTTDSFPKISQFEGKADGRPFQIMGVAKGAGMIMPQMATMLCFVITDIGIGAEALQKAVSSSAEKTFNRVSVDGDTSTNDTVLVMANGMAGNGTLSPDGVEGFQKGLTFVMRDLATMLVRDGEGASKLIYVKIKGAATADDALTAARTIANSSLVKTAFYGQDPNWGRIMAALGRSGIHMNEEKVSIWVDDVKIVEGGLGTGADHEKEAAERMTQREFSLTVDLHQGRHEDMMITCDLTHKYITINADYRT